MVEGEPVKPQQILNPESIAGVLGAELQRPGSKDPELLLAGVSDIRVRLTLHTERDAVSFYARTGRYFAGFLHMAGIRRVELKPEQGEVHFIVPFGDNLCDFAVTAGGQLLALANVDKKTRFTAPETTPPGSPDPISEAPAKAERARPRTWLITFNHRIGDLETVGYHTVEATSPEEAHNIAVSYFTGYWGEAEKISERKFYYPLVGAGVDIETIEEATPEEIFRRLRIGIHRPSL